MPSAPRGGAASRIYPAEALRLASERAWVQAFDWAMLDRSAGIYLTLLRRSRSRAAGDALRRAA